MIEKDNSAVPWWQAFADATDKLPASQRANRLAELAAVAGQRGEQNAAKVLALRAWRQARQIGDGKSGETVRRALSAVTRGYQVHISTDANRIATWQAALQDVIQPGMLALEIGAGSGILAMLAAQAGAEVVSCERDPILAAMADETVRQNGLSGQVHIIGKSAAALHIPEDMPRPADILILDLFANNLFAFDPFKIIAAARRLLRPGAVVVPIRVSLHGALANFRRWQRLVPTRVGGFDLSSLLDIAALEVNLDPADPDLAICSGVERMVTATLPDELPPEAGVSERAVISHGGPVNGIALWLRLELSAGHVIEAMPGRAPRGFYARPRFYAFTKTLDTLAGQAYPIRLRWKGNSVSIGQTEP